ncbi:MAG: methyltransferase domain-containing protein [Deltaproteobacteria bacterium]|nr:methyltransferase domain-containing protein [Deltaproteobacteria bacterium]
MSGDSLTTRPHCGPPEFDLSAEAFARQDENDDSVFYATERFVNHLDSLALDTVERVIGELVIEDDPVILDLMTGGDSHIPSRLKPARVIGLGLNEKELSQNKALTEFVIHDLNKCPTLPFLDNTFDAVINTVSVDYLTQPVEVFTEVGRILKPGGLFLIIFSNRMFMPKVVKVWREALEERRVDIVKWWLARAQQFEMPDVFVSRGKPRPADDKYAGLGLPSDPVYVVYTDKKGAGDARRARPEINLEYGRRLGPEELQRLQKEIKHTLSCPHCGQKMRKWEVPDTPFGCNWDHEFMYICFNDACPYFVRGWEVMEQNGVGGKSYRLMWHPARDYCVPVPVPSFHALKESIID